MQPLPLTVMMIVENNKDTVEKTFESIIQTNPAQILIGNINSRDDSLKICKSYKADIINFPANINRSKACNNLSKYANNEWCLYLYPWEVIIFGKEKLLDMTNSSYSLKILQDKVITKEVRLFKKNAKFKNPIFEKIIGKDSKNKDIIIWNNNENYLVKNLKKIQAWRDAEPLNTEPYYYLASAYLVKKQYNKFINCANHYLFHEKNNAINKTIIRYYLSIIQNLVLDKKNESIENIIICLAENILMAEFWCVLGDVFFETGDFDRATTFYENAIILGSRRLNDDNWPVFISKYKEYPESMIEKCNSIKQSVGYFNQ